MGEINKVCEFYKSDSGFLFGIYCPDHVNSLTIIIGLWRYRLRFNIQRKIKTEAGNE